MKKIFLIGWKDVRLAFRDRAALILMLAAPFVLTIGLGFITGRLSGGGGGLSDIPVIVVNQDGGQLGHALANLFASKDLNGLLKPSTLTDPAAARRQVDDDRAAAAVIIPAGFTQSIIPAAGPGGGVSAPVEAKPVQIELYTNAGSPTGAGVVMAVVAGFLNQVERGSAGGQAAVTQLLASGLITPQDAPRIGQEIGQRAGQAQASITVNDVVSGQQTAPQQPVQFDILAYMAPGMALMFLMFTATNGGRTLLAERNQGTLPRLLVSPTSRGQVLAGKVLGIYLTGVVQVLLLIGASALLFRLRWGDAWGVLALVLAAVAGAVGWGMIITALAKTPGQVSSIGSALVLIFGIMGGGFVSLDAMPAWFRVVNKITPNAWGVEGFTVLAFGGRLADVWGPIVALLVMGVVLFAVAAAILSRRGLAEA